MHNERETLNCHNCIIIIAGMIGYKCTKAVAAGVHISQPLDIERPELSLSLFTGSSADNAFNGALIGLHSEDAQDARLTAL